MPDREEGDVAKFLELLPTSLMVMSSAHERRRAAVLVHRVIQCADEPPLVCVAARKGHGVAPLIRDSHSFGLSLIDPKDRLLIRKFESAGPLDGDPFDSVEVSRIATGAPLIARAAAAADLDVVRHFDLEDTDHELYVGRVVAVRVGSEPV